ncbi:MAG: polysaccharide deacetylase family protein [Paenisporosarcina sp.]|nr:polysaccharide deacetylase family protein [Paenisporosarcina sp.]
MMKLKFQVLFFLIISISIFAFPTHSEADSHRYIALHDRVLTFEKNEVRLVNAQMVVPFEKMARYLYADIVKTKDLITITKNNTSITYNLLTNETTVNQTVIMNNAVQMIDNVPYISIRFLGESTGFKVDYLSTFLTARLYSDKHPHLSNSEFILKVKASKPAIPAPKPISTEPTGKPIVYLTFDDGPNRYTTEHLRILKEYKVKGTFFFVGNQISSYKSVTKQAFSEGHYLGLHSMSHERKKVYETPQAFLEEMKQVNGLIKNMTGHTSALVRAPYGSKPYVSQSMRELLKDQGYKLWDWDVDTQDWQIQEANFQQILTNVKAGVEKARLAKDQHIVVLLHDRVQTTKALPGIITWLQKQGYSIQPYNSSLHVTQNFWHDKKL